MMINVFISGTNVSFVQYILPFKFMDAPAHTCWFALRDAVHSTAFLSAFVGIFQVAFDLFLFSYFKMVKMFLVVCGWCKGVICLHRKVATRDHKLVYWIAGGISALSVLLEKKSRRAELALYVLPRAGDSLWYILVNRHLLPNIRNAEVLLLYNIAFLHWLNTIPDAVIYFACFILNDAGFFSPRWFSV